MTDETTEEEQERRGASDHAIACQLVRGGYITHAQAEVWSRSRAQETVWSMRRDYPNQARGGQPFSGVTLYKWVQEVDAAIAAARLIDAPAVAEPSPWRIPIADGHEVREAANPTPAGRVSTEASSWDAERLKAAGAVDRYSRKRG